MTALRLNLLGWTNEEAGDVIGMNRNAVVDFQQNFLDLKNLSKNLLAQGHPHLTVAERQKMPLQLVWAID